MVSAFARMRTYTGGPETFQYQYDETGIESSVVENYYGPEGELLGTAGSTENVTYGYDPCYRLRYIFDGKGNWTNIYYDVAGRRTQVLYPDSDTLVNSLFDGDGNVVQTTNDSYITANFTHGDGDGLLSAISYPTNTNLNVTCQYDQYDRPTLINDAPGSTTFAYDDLDLKMQQTRTFTGLSPVSLNYTYWPDGSRNQMTNPAGTWSYNYDAAGNVTSMASPAGTTAWGYYANGLLSSQIFGNGMAAASYTYNAPGYLSSLTNTANGTTESSFNSFQYDGNFNLLSFSSSFPGASSLSGTTTYGYDPYKFRLTSETSPATSGSNQAFAYDGAGNPTTFANTSGLTFDPDNQRTGTGFAYNYNGNPTNYNGLSTTFDPTNHATTFGVNQLSCGYGADGLRAWKQDPAVQKIGLISQRAVGHALNTQGPGTKTYFVYDGEDPVLELNSSGSVNAVNVFGSNGLIARDMPASNFVDPYLFNPRGDISEYNIGAGNMIHAAYTAYGSQVSTPFASTDPFGFGAQAGYYLDYETGAYLCGQRYYSTATGGWLSRDPIGYSGGINVYAYCMGNPAYDLDPMGLQGVGQPGFGESLIPVWGSGRAAIDDIQNGNWGWAAFDSLMCVSDCLMVGTLVKTIGKCGLKVCVMAARGTAYNTVRRGMRSLARFPGQHAHHILKQAVIGENWLLKAIFNQPAMLTFVPRQAEYKGIMYGMNGYHMLLDGKCVFGNQMNILERLYYGSNTFQKSAATSIMGRGVWAATGH